MSNYETIIITCPKCQCRDDIQCFDVGGLDDGDLACNQCGAIFAQTDETTTYGTLEAEAD